eukprot:c28529_g3_i1 orf=247-582(-)
MAANNTTRASAPPPPPPLADLDAKWDACYDITLRRFVYSSLTGAFSALLFFRSPASRWAAIAFGAGFGLGSAYTDCSHIFDVSMPRLPLPSDVSMPNASSSPSAASSHSEV